MSKINTEIFEVSKESCLFGIIPKNNFCVYFDTDRNGEPICRACLRCECVKKK